MRFGGLILQPPIAAFNDPLAFAPGAPGALLRLGCSLRLRCERLPIMNTPLDINLGVIGVGNMGGALLAGVVQAAVVSPSRIQIFDTRSDVLEATRSALGVTISESNRALVASSDVVLLCVKPQVMAAVLGGFADAFGPETALVSVAAGITCAALERQVPPGTPVVRAMPNTPCLVGKGASGWSRGTAVTDRHAAWAEAILGAVGYVCEIPETSMNALTAVSGSGPAYIFHAIEAMIAGGVALGLPSELSSKLALHTVAGAGALAVSADVAPGTLRQRVMSPGGTTEAAIGVLRSRDFQDAIVAAMQRAHDRGEEMAAELSS